MNLVISVTTNNTLQDKNVFTNKSHIKYGIDASILFSVRKFFAYSKLSLKYHIGPPLCKKYATEKNGYARILDASLTYLTTLIDNASIKPSKFGRKQRKCATPVFVFGVSWGMYGYRALAAVPASRSRT
jgi:hypothetical protein